MPITVPLAKQWASESSHWYCAKTGDPRYTVIGAKGQERNTTLADARKLDLVPSVTTIAAVEAKPQLTNWLVQQGMLACLTLPRMPGETDQAFMARALEDSKQQARKAAERGTYLHGLLENAIRSTGVGTPDGLSMEDHAYVMPVIFWIRDHFQGYTWHPERSFSHPTLKYGGKVDLHGTHPEKPPVVLDYKSKDFCDPDKKLAYDEHCSQLCAYSHGLFGHIDSTLANLFVSSTQPGLIVAVEWGDVEKKAGWEAFQACLALWRARKKF